MIPLVELPWTCNCSRPSKSPAVSLTSRRQPTRETRTGPMHSIATGSAPARHSEQSTSASPIKKRPAISHSDPSTPTTAEGCPSALKGVSVRGTPNGHDRTCLSDVFAAVPSATRSRSTRSRRSNHSCGWPTRSPSAWRRRTSGLPQSRAPSPKWCSACRPRAPAGRSVAPQPDSRLAVACSPPRHFSRGCLNRPTHA
jgi:hypothetical protein